MNKKWLSIIGGLIISLVVIVGVITLNSHENKKVKNAGEPKLAKKIVEKINQSQSNSNWKVTINNIKTEKTETKKHVYTYYVSDDNNVLNDRTAWYYRTVINATIENKSDQDVKTSSSDGNITLIDGDGNTRTGSGTTLQSYSDFSPISLQNFPSKSKTAVQFIVIGNKNDFNHKGLRIQIPTYYPGETTDNGYPGATFQFQ